jgi:hypothetical protein
MLLTLEQALALEVRLAVPLSASKHESAAMTLNHCATRSRETRTTSLPDSTARRGAIDHRQPQCVI